MKSIGHYYVLLITEVHKEIDYYSSVWNENLIRLYIAKTVRCSSFRMTSSLISTIAILSCCFVAHIAATNYKTFQVQIDVNGTRVCSTSQPTTVIPMDVGTLDGQCGVQCTVSSYCQFHQFKAKLTQCEIFYDKPLKTSMTVVDQCVAYTSLTTGKH